MFINRLEI